MEATTARHWKPLLIFLSHIKTEYILVFVSLVAWLTVNMVFIIAELDWLKSSDSGWYWSKTLNLTPFDPAIVVGYPIIWRVFVELFPGMSPVILGQSINILAFSLTTIVIHRLMVELDITHPALATLPIILYPLIGAANLIAPRVNALLQLLVFLAILMYVRGHSLRFAFVTATILLAHRSALPLVGMLFLVGFWERKIAYWTIPIIPFPLAIYWLIGISQGHSLTWYLTGYQKYEKIIGLPLGDGLFGTLALGLRGSFSDFAQFLILILVWSLAVFLLLARVWSSRPFLLALIVPVIFLGLIQPAAEIFAVYNYTSYFALPVLFYMQKQGFWPLGRFPYTLLIVILAALQLVWAIYTVNYLI